MAPAEEAIGDVDFMWILMTHPDLLRHDIFADPI
jgi:hypothetical protein